VPGTVGPWKSRAPWNVRAIPLAVSSCGARRVTVAPSSRTLPPSARRCPEMRLMSVVLPAPFGPMSPKACPAATARSTRSTAWTPPKVLLSCRVSSNIRGSDPAREIDDDREQDGSLEDVAVVLERAQQLGQRGEDRRAEDGAEDVRDTTDDGEHEDLHGLRERKVVGVDRERDVRGEAAGPRGEQRAEDERRELVPAHRAPLARGRAGGERERERRAQVTAEQRRGVRADRHEGGVPERELTRVEREPDRERKQRVDADDRERRRIGGQEVGDRVHLDPVRRPLPEEALRPRDEHEEEEAERECVAQLCRAVQEARDLAEPGDGRAEDRARKAAHPADDHHGEG